jgi:lipoprotein-releasing system permease protein
MTNAQKAQECRVVGFFDLNVSNLNKTWAITSLETTNALFETSGTVSSIEIQVDAIRHLRQMKLQQKYQIR